MKKLFIPLVAILAMPSASMASPKATVVVAKKPVVSTAAAKAQALIEVAAKADLARMNKKLTAAEGLSYGSTITYVVPSQSAPGYTMQSATAIVTVERPNHLSIATAVAGATLASLFSSGSKVTIYDSSAQKYSQADTMSDMDSTRAAFGATGSAIFTGPTPSAESLRQALGFPMRFLNSEFIIPSPQAGSSLHFGLSSHLVDGKTLTSVSETLSSAGRDSLRLTFVIDPTQNLPVSQTVQEISPTKGASVTVISEKFSDFKVLSAPELPAVFAFSPPATATLVAPVSMTPPDGQGVAPAPSPAAPGTPAAPSAPMNPAAPTTPATPPN